MYKVGDFGVYRKSKDGCFCRTDHTCKIFYNSSLKTTETAKTWHGSSLDGSLQRLWFCGDRIIQYGCCRIRIITKLPNSEQSYKGKVKTHNYINRQNQSTTGKLWKP